MMVRPSADGIRSAQPKDPKDEKNSCTGNWIRKRDICSQWEMEKEATRTRIYLLMPVSYHQHPFASRKRLRSNDPFFASGDKIAFHSTNTQIFFYTEEDGCNYVSEGKEMNSKFSGRTDCSVFPCSACGEHFDSLEECDSHYLHAHSLECHECHKALPNAHLLDLHLQESHDSYFAAAISKGKASYKCLIASCCSSFPNEKLRSEHLIGVHLYPKWFRFHERGAKRAKVKSGASAMVNATTKIPGKRRPKSRNIVPKDSKKAIEADDERRQQHSAKIREKRKARQKLARSRVPCKFYHMEGSCQRGDKCDFLHGIEAVESYFVGDAKEGSAFACQDNNQMDIDELTEQFEQSARIPDSIHFGRRR